MRLVKNLVGVSVADAAEETRIGERSFKVWFSRRRVFGEVLKSTLEHFERAAVEIAQRRLALRRVK